MSESSEDEFDENFGENEENSGDFDGNFGELDDEIMLPKKQTPLFPTPPHTPTNRRIGEKRCSPCTNEVGATKAKKTRRQCFKCEKPTCQTHSLTICTFCAQNSAF